LGAVFLLAEGASSSDCLGMRSCFVFDFVIVWLSWGLSLWIAANVL
jgi:hypothetical protein